MSLIAEVVGYWQKGGWLLIPIAIVCCCIVYYVMRMNQRLEIILTFSDKEESQIQQALNDKRPVEKLEQTVKQQHYYFVNILNYSLIKVKEQREHSTIFEEIRQKEIAPFENDLTIVKALVTSAPLLGLLGTVFGMIGTFDAIAEKSSDTTELMASGISQGLLTTQFGLIVAIFGIVGISMLTKKIELLNTKITNLQIHFAAGLGRLK